MFYDVEQNTDEWFNLRLGVLTGSGIGKAMANYGKAFGDPAKKYAIDLAIEQITGRRSGPSYSNAHMERGHEEEPLARMAYEDMYFCDVTNGGFFRVDECGCSPDGMVGDDGLVEIKSAISSIHYKRVKKKLYDSTYKWQLAGNLMLTGRDWIDFISYCSDYPDDKKLFVFRCDKDLFKKEFEMMDSRIPEFLDLIKETKVNILNS